MIITYGLVVVNNGPDTATGVQLHGVLRVNAAPSVIDPSAGHYDDQKASVSCYAPVAYRVVCDLARLSQLSPKIVNFSSRPAWGGV
jgi:hypothetical protein